MAATPYAALIARVRVDGRDTATSNPHLGETPIGQRTGGGQAIFRLAYPNVVPASIFLTYGTGIIRQPAGSGTFQVLDPATSYLQMLGAGIPDASLTQPFYFDYFAQWFTDAEYTSMIDTATEELGALAGVAVVEGLYPALIKYVLAHYWTARSSQFATLFASKAATAESDPSTPAKAFLALGKAARAEGDKLRDAYMQGFGANKQPASGTITYGVDPITPRY